MGLGQKTVLAPAFELRIVVRTLYHDGRLVATLEEGFWSTEFANYTTLVVEQARLRFFTADGREQEVVACDQVSVMGAAVRVGQGAQRLLANIDEAMQQWRTADDGSYWEGFLLTGCLKART
jgi:hypothetical protein